MTDARGKIINILDKDRKWPDAAETADAILSALPDIMRGMVKPLVWCDHGAGYNYQSYATNDAQTYDYDVGCCDDYGWFFVENVSGYECSDHYPTKEAAQAAAEAHHVSQAMAVFGEGE